jgi:hypothetical protein
MHICPVCGAQDAARRTSGESDSFFCLDCAHIWRMPVGAGAADGGLAAMAGPRDALRRLWRITPPGEAVTVSAPVDDPPDAAFPDGEWNRFSAEGLRLLIARCGFRRRSEYFRRAAGRCRLTVEATRVPPPGGAAAARAYLDDLTAARRRAAARIAAVTEPAALWGVGSDLTIMAATVPALREGLATGRFALFDRTAAGKTHYGQAVASPDALPTFGGVVFPTPSSGDVRREMRAAALRWVGAQIRFVDPYAGPFNVASPYADGDR